MSITSRPSCVCPSCGDLFLTPREVADHLAEPDPDAGSRCREDLIDRGLLMSSWVRGSPVAERTLVLAGSLYLVAGRHAFSVMGVTPTGRRQRIARRQRRIDAEAEIAQIVTGGRRC